jgi:hypothetical protein
MNHSFDHAIGLHQSGRQAEAERVYRGSERGHATFTDDMAVEIAGDRLPLKSPPLLSRIGL